MFWSFLRFEKVSKPYVYLNLPSKALLLWKQWPICIIVKGIRKHIGEKEVKQQLSFINLHVFTAPSENKKKGKSHGAIMAS